MLHHIIVSFVPDERFFEDSPSGTNVHVWRKSPAAEGVAGWGGGEAGCLDPRVQERGAKDVNVNPSI